VTKASTDDYPATEQVITMAQRRGDGNVLSKWRYNVLNGLEQ
jgi:hypothetical protein